MLLHCVFLNFRGDVPEAEKAEILTALGALKSEVDGFLDYAWGPNLDFEAKSPDHGMGFVCTFRDRAAHLAYERHPRHVELGGRLVAGCVGGAEGIVVYDLDIG